MPNDHCCPKRLLKPPGVRRNGLTAGEMEFINGLNILVGPLGALLLMAVDSLRRHSADTVQRNIMLALIGAAILAILCELAYDAYANAPGAVAYAVLYASCFAFFIFQLLTFSIIPLFLDYAINQDMGRLKKLALLMGALWTVNLTFLLLNIGSGFYFQITPENTYLRGEGHIIRVVCDYLPLLVIFGDMLLCRKNVRPEHILLSLLAVVPAGVSGLIDLAFPGVRLLWPFFALSLLFVYLFIVRAAYSLDSITGVYNRRKCDEFLDELARAPRRKPYVFMMLDMDRFKEINDTFGHAQGDQALRDVAVILKSSVRNLDFVARYGGDEFFIIFDNCDKAAAVCARIEDGIAALNADGTRPYTLKVSLGYDIYYPNDPASPQAFLSHVDSLMFHNKNKRRQDNAGSGAPGVVMERRLQ